jgi:protocatechuate 3,4-dioxygenase beta subunit
MDNDDRQLGHILSRREILALFGTAGLTMLAACAPGQTSTAQPTSAASQAPAAATAMATTATSAATTPTATRAATAAATATSATAAAAAPTAAATATGVPATMTTAPTAITAATQAAAASTSVVVPSCIVRPEVTEGPYYVAEELNRADVRSDPGSGTVKAGALLTLTFNVSQISGSACTPLAGAKVEIWHCDAAGVYSDVTDRSFSTKGQQFLRGYQVTDANGQATFTTIYPGWYSGRAIHIHFKVHPTATTVFTSQLFFDDALSDQVFTQAPYASKGKRDTLNSRDSIYKSLLLLSTAKTAQGYTASFDIGVQKG